MKSMRSKRSMIFEITNWSVLLLFSVLCLVPMLNIVAKSFSSEAAITTGRVWLWPAGFNINAYRFVITGNFAKPFLIQTIITASGTMLSIVLLLLLAYPLSRKDLAMKKPVMVLIMFTMLFNAGIIPNYLLISQLGLMNNLLSVILPGAFSGFNLLLVKAYMQSIPDAVVESALVEGAGHATILVSIIVPFSVPVLATMVLFNAVGYWNSYFEAMIYLTRPGLKPLQVYLREIVMFSLQNITDNYVYDVDSALSRSPEAIRAASIMATTIPILLVYPFLQKYYIKGIMIGSVKG